jgi:hypothetical protein
MNTNVPQELSADAALKLQPFVNSTERTDDQIRRRIESLAVSADVKALLSDLLRVTTQVGETILRIGRKILDFILSLARHFPTLTFAIVIAAVLTTLLAMVPFLSGILASIAGPLTFVVGITDAALREAQSDDFRQRVAEFASQFKAAAA